MPQIEKNQKDLDITAAQYLCKHVDEETVIQALLREGASLRQAVLAVYNFNVDTRKAVTTFDMELFCMKAILEAQDMMRCAAEAQDTKTRIQASALKLKWVQELNKHRHGNR